MRPDRPVDEDPADAVLLDGVAHDHGRPKRRISRRKPVVLLAVVTAVAAVAALFVGLVVSATEPPARAARLVPLDPHFGDPFSVDWSPMEGQQELPPPANRPLPMVGVDPPCVGFERLDWPESTRHPTVAHCVDADAVDAMAEDEVAVVRKILAGADTWYLIRFGVEPRSVAAVFDDTALDSLEPTPMSWMAGPYMAVLLPTDSGPFIVHWDVGSERLHCRFGPRRSESATCD